jgi:integrase
MAVFKKQGVYWIDYYVNGRRKRERIGPDKRLAETVLQKRKVAIAEGRYLDKRKVPRCTFDELALVYLCWAETHHQGFATTRSRVKRFQETFGSYQLSGITPLMVDEYLSKRTTERQPASVNKKAQLLHHMFKKAMAWGKVPENPATHVRPLRVNNRRLRYLSHEEIGSLLAVADGHLRPMNITALHTGLRRGEMFALTWQDVDFTLGVIRVLHTKNGERREIPMSHTLRDTLQQIPDGLAQTACSQDVPGRTGRGMSNIRGRFHRALREAGIHGFRWHDLRHSFASHLIMAGANITSVKELMGHKTLAVTLRYAHLAPDFQRDAINRLDTYMGTTPSEPAVTAR